MHWTVFAFLAVAACAITCELVVGLNKPPALPSVTARDPTGLFIILGFFAVVLLILVIVLRPGGPGR